MINNRQGGRRRGRGGQRPQGLAGNAGGNARDNRQRGNAAQLLEKYKSMARDAQLSGDRVQTEYFLQFADHYFRVLDEGRSRFDEQNQRRPRGDEDGDDEGDDLAEAEADTGDDAGEPPRRQERSKSDNDRSERSDRPNGRLRDRPREGAGEKIDFDVLPPAIGSDDAADSSRPDGDGDEVSPRPRRRARKPRAGEGEGDDATVG